MVTRYVVPDAIWHIIDPLLVMDEIRPGSFKNILEVALNKIVAPI